MSMLESNASRTQRRQCDVCGRQFSRTDTLRRHMRVHNDEHASLVSRQKACLRCTRSKIRCSGELPKCSNCDKRGAACRYKQDQSRETTTDLNVGFESSPAGHEHRGPILEADISASANEESYIASTMDPSLATTAFADLNFSGPFFDGSTENALDWMFHDGIELFSPSDVPLPSQDRLWNHLPPPPFPDWTSNVVANSEVIRHDGAHEMSSASPLDSLAVPDEDKREEAEEDRWPMEWKASRVSFNKLSSLNTSGTSIHENHFSFPTVQPVSLTLRDLLFVASDHAIWPSVDLLSFPGASELDYCIDAYFVHFDKFVPIVHTATFSPSEEPLITLAVIAIGACYTNLNGVREFSSSLIEFTRRLLVYMSEQDPRFVRTVSYITTELLLSYYSYGCGNKRFYELADCDRSALINNTRCAGLFQNLPAENSTTTDMQENWKKWIRAETFRRLSWAVYVYDAASATMEDDRPFLPLQELKMGLPCEAKYWEARTPQAWTALHPWTSKAPSPASFEHTLQKLLEDPAHAVANMSDDFHRHIMISTVTRLMWSLKEQTTQPCAEYLSPYHAVQEGKRNLSNTVNHFSFSPRSLGTPDVSRIQQLCLVQLTHILAADDVWDYLHLIWRRGSQVEVGEAHMRDWILANPVSSRKFIVATSQLFSIHHLYPSNHPQDAYNVFHAGLAVWVMARLISEGEARSNHTVVSTSCHLDWLGPENTTEAHAIDDWVRTGSPQYTVRMYGVPNLFDKNGPGHVLRRTAGVLHLMPVWGIAQVLRNATLRILRSTT